jgi:hypothetical protein
MDFELKMRILLISLLGMSLIFTLIITYFEKKNNIKKDLAKEKEESILLEEKFTTKKEKTFEEELNEIFNF